MVSKDDVMKVLEDVYDPELGVDIVSIGLVYEVSINDENDVEVLMTFTFPGCPYGDSLVDEAEEAIKGVEGVRNIKVNVTFEPPWNPDMMDPDIRSALGL